MVNPISFALVLAGATRSLTLGEAIETARTHQPQLREVHANTEAAAAVADEARAPLLPQVTASAAYARATANFILRPGSPLPSATTGGIPANATSYNFLSSGVTVFQLLYDFGQTSQRWRAQQVSFRATSLLESSARSDLDLAVRATFFGARANRALVGVAEATVANVRRHVDQTQAFVDAGTRPEIDLFQSRADLAAADVQLISARSNYGQSRAQLNQAMGVEGPIDFDIADDGLPPVPGEDATTDALLERALAQRPEVTSLAQQLRAQQLMASSVRGQYGPSIAGVAGVVQGADARDRAGWNAQVGVAMTWSFYQGGLTGASVREAEAHIRHLAAQSDALRQLIRLQIEQVRLAVAAAKASQVSAHEAEANVRARLRLAEGRYRSGVGNIIEVSDAQVALTSASTQVITAEFQLATARAQLIQVLGASEGGGN